MLGRIDESIAWTIRAWEIEPEDPACTGTLAELLVDLGDHATALQLEPEPGIGLLVKRRRYQEAIDVGEWQMIEEPDDIHSRYWLAFAYNVVGWPSDAVRVLNASGLPDTAMPEAREAADLEALVTFIHALDAAGDAEFSHALAEQWIERRHTQSPNWWISFYMACALSAADRHEEALLRLEQVAASPRLPWSFLLRDSRCLQRYAGEPPYKRAVESLERRQAELRRRLPDTLRRFSVSLPLVQSPEKNRVMPTEKP